MGGSTGPRRSPSPSRSTPTTSCGRGTSATPARPAPDRGWRRTPTGDLTVEGREDIFVGLPKYGFSISTPRLALGGGGDQAGRIPQVPMYGNMRHLGERFHEVLHSLFFDLSYTCLEILQSFCQKTCAGYNQLVLARRHSNFSQTGYT